MPDTNFYLCYENTPNQSEEFLLHKFWMLEDGTKYKFKYNICELQGILGFKNARYVSNFVKTNCFISSNATTHNCDYCKKKFCARNRSEFIKFVKSPPRFCENCYEIQINAIALEKIDLLEASEYLSSPDFIIQDLSYLEQISLLIMLSELDITHGKASVFIQDELNLTGVYEFDIDLLSALLRKNAIYYIDEKDYDPPTLVQEINFYEIQYGQYLYPHVLHALTLQQQKFKKPGVYFSTPANFNNLDEVKDYLFEQINNAELTLFDVEKMSEFIITSLVDKAYQLVNEVKYRHNISVEMKMKLDTVITRLVNNYSLSVAYSMLDYQAMRVSAQYNATPYMPSYVKDKLLAKLVEEHMSKLETYNNIPYVKKLPFHILSSRIEDFVSYYIFAGQLSWSSLSGDEIIEKWLNSPTIKLIE
jgi:hypothetical protein